MTGSEAACSAARWATPSARRSSYVTQSLELREEIERAADDLYDATHEGRVDWDRYPA